MTKVVCIAAIVLLSVGCRPKPPVQCLSGEGLKGDILEVPERRGVYVDPFGVNRVWIVPAHGEVRWACVRRV